MKKHNWATVKGKVVGVRFGDKEHQDLEARAEVRQMSSGEYLRWLFRMTAEVQGVLLVRQGELSWPSEE